MLNELAISRFLFSLKMSLLSENFTIKEFILIKVSTTWSLAELHVVSVPLNLVLLRNN